jgi:pimeloyl-ACP methyl ester carboxylesterase
VFAAIACVSGAFVDRITGSGLAGLGGGFAAFIALLRWPGRRAHLSLLLDDWIFSRDYIRRGNRVLQERLDRIARTIATEMERGRAEIVVVGHSLGAVLAIDLLDRVLARNPGIGRGASRLALLSVGSSILKIGLHRRALRFRAALERVGLAGGVFWAEYQALTDVMNFYKSDPIATLGLKPCSKPLVRVVRISQMLELDTYRRVRRNFYRVHCQFVSGNDRRAAYDYFMLLCGPLPVERQARSPDGAVSAFSEDGALLPDAPHKPTCEGSQRVCDR